MRKMVTAVSLILFSLVLTTAAFAFMVTVDADLSEWPAASLDADGNEPDINDGLDIALQGQTNDANNLYGAFTTQDTTIWRVDLPAAPGAQPYVTVCIDADGDPATGENRPALCTGPGGYDYFFDVAMCNPPNFAPCSAQPVEVYDLYDCTVGTQNGSLADCIFTEGAISGSDTEWADDTTEWAIPLSVLSGFNLADVCDDSTASKTRYTSMFFNGAGQFVQDPDDRTDFQWTIDCTGMATTIALLDAYIGPNGLAVVSWATVSEETTEGFYVYRADNPAQMPPTPQSDFIPAQNVGLPQGASYEWEDAEPLPDYSTFYWLEVYDIDGITSYGPLEVVPVTTAVDLADLSVQAAPFWREMLPIIISGFAIALVILIIILRRKRRPGD